MTDRKGQKLSDVLGLRFTHEERQAISKAAAARGFETDAQFARYVIRAALRDITPHEYLAQEICRRAGA